MDHDESNTPAPLSTGGPFAAVPAAVVDLCQSLVDFVGASVGLRPDFTPETLPLVDHYAREAQKALADRPQVLDLTAHALGAYFGEVARRHLACFWQLPTPNHHDWLICGEAAYLAINPIGVGYDALTGGTEHHGPSSQLKLAAEDRAAVEHRLSLLPEVDAAEYFSLSTRLEVLEIAMEAVRSQAIARGYEDITYDRRDYETDLSAHNLLS